MCCLHCVAVRCSVLQHVPFAMEWLLAVGFVAVCCSVLQCVAVCCSALQCVAVCCSVLQCVALCRIVSHCVAVCCSVLQYVAVCCSVLQCVAVCCSVFQVVQGAMGWLRAADFLNWYVSFAKESYKKGGSFAIATYI